MSAEFYVYAYLRTDGTPYYIGKGKGQRAYKPHRRVSKPSNNRIKILIDNLEETDAFEWEKTLIKTYGREDNQSGILKNRSDGGEGVANQVNKKWINDGVIERRIDMEDEVPDQWNVGRLWSMSDYFCINNGIENKLIKKTKTITKGWKKGRIGSSNSDKISITNKKETKFIDKNDLIPEGWRRGIAFRHDKESLNKIAEGNSKWMWITNGKDSNRIKKIDMIPVGWYKGRVMNRVVTELVRDNVKMREKSGTIQVKKL